MLSPVLAAVLATSARASTTSPALLAGRSVAADGSAASAAAASAPFSWQHDGYTAPPRRLALRDMDLRETPEWLSECDEATGVGCDQDGFKVVVCDPMEPLPWEYWPAGGEAAYGAAGVDLCYSEACSNGTKKRQLTCNEAMPYFLGSMVPVHFLIGFVAVVACIVNTATVVGVGFSKTNMVDQQTLWLTGVFQASTDFFMSWLTTPPYLVAMAEQRWVGGKPMCDAIGFFVHFFAPVMILQRTFVD